jgi:hypothetical protein
VLSWLTKTSTTISCACCSAEIRRSISFGCRDAGLSDADDETLLAWAAERERILLTHDVPTITAYAYQRASSGDRMPGVFELSRDVSIPGEWEGQVRYLPLR